MRRIPEIFILTGLFLMTPLLSGQQKIPGRSLGPGWTIVDFVDIPARYTPSPGKDLYLEFTEHWMVDSDRPAIRKEVIQWNPHLSTRPQGSKSEPGEDSLFSVLSSLLPEGRNGTRVMTVEYEFHFLDPHVAGTPNRALSSPDSLDVQTSELQRTMAALAGSRIPRSDRLELEANMLSVIFHEQWLILPPSGKLTKKVEAVTPVIWQRRQTVDGTPLNDADTGLPVYFKNTLQRIELRNP